MATDNRRQRHARLRMEQPVEQVLRLVLYCLDGALADAETQSGIADSARNEDGIAGLRAGPPDDVALWNTTESRDRNGHAAARPDRVATEERHSVVRLVSKETGREPLHPH